MIPKFTCAILIQCSVMQVKTGVELVGESGVSLDQIVEQVTAMNIRPVTGRFEGTLDLTSNLNLVLNIHRSKLLPIRAAKAVSGLLFCSNP